MQIIIQCLDNNSWTVTVQCPDSNNWTLIVQVIVEEQF
jgi:hypothetical protein